LSESMPSRGPLTSTDADDLWSVLVGRRATDEDAAMTPIFHSLALASRRAPQAELPGTSVTTGEEPRRGAEPVAPLRREPLHREPPRPEPAPREALDAPPPGTSAGPRRRSGAHAAEERRGGRHHRRFVPLEGGGAEG